MSYEIREGEGSLFANERKEGKQPDYRGQVRIGGVLYRLSGWKRTSKSGTRWLALKADEEHQQRTEAKAAPGEKPQQQPSDEFDDAVPF